ncbi:M12 family metallo-peptidase [Flavobacterium selenitireducens]|uniref:M12 family metallo-peptidase n=1 Tax=Flavobacterium selenitireducens TaxID=2722704 RepID=UPI00168B841C|nr:M12 family metallo-peptidase [Flavobacterium selenitireducens]MBD3581702.1 T9SS type A sorting domain-containing protein [Flavobacterium selenitireducens]
MKKILTLFVCFLTISMLGQQKIAERVAELKDAKTNFRQFSVLDASSEIPAGEIAQVVEKASFARLRTADVNAIANSKPDAIEVAVPYLGNQLIVELFKVDLFNESFHIDTDKQKNIAYEKGAYYRGIVKGDNGSLVSMNFFNGEMSGVISGDDIGNVVVGRLQKAGNVENYIIYSDADLKINNPFSCGMKEDGTSEIKPNEDGSTDRAVLSTRCVSVYFEIDNVIYVQNNSNTTTVGNWMTGVFNNVATLYSNANISVGLKSTFIWTTPDPYSGESSGDYLNQFNELRPVFDGDIGMLVGIDAGGLGGVAATIDGLCSSSNYSYSDVDLSYSSVPTYSWTVMVVTHEMGHLLGSPHTHACAWNGNNTPIDNCAPSALGGGEGSNCMSSPPIIPSSAVRGTIMSYCHLVPGVGISFNNGFGPQPAQRILQNVNSSSCLSTDCVNTCINLIAEIQAENVTTNAATITWDETGSASAWQILVNLFPSTIGFYQNAQNPTYNAANLQPNTFYKARIRPACQTGVISSVRQAIFATAADWCSGVTITDTGGANGDYTNEESYVRVLIPTQPNKRIELALTQFDLETDFDFLYIYDGASTSATDLSGGGLTGANLEAPFPTYTSSSPDGALTIRFFSDQGVTEGGYAATISCEGMLGVNNNQNIDFTYYPNPAKDAVNIVSKTEITSIEVYNVTGQLLYATKANTLETKVDISAYSTGTYFFKLKFGEYAANFKIMKF